MCGWTKALRIRICRQAGKANTLDMRRGAHACAWAPLPFAREQTYGVFGLPSFISRSVSAASFATASPAASTSWPAPRIVLQLARPAAPVMARRRANAAALVLVITKLLLRSQRIPRRPGDQRRAQGRVPAELRA